MPDAFRLDWIQFLYESRWPPATAFFAFFTFLGEIEGYILVVCGIYVAWDKKLAFRLSVVALAAMSLNHVLKMLIALPRPFIVEGTHAEKWAVSPGRAAELATEYSTPSGHAMTGAAFYGALYAWLPRRGVRIVAVALLLLTGASRPYLGVHYVEDVALGWALGIAIALAAVVLAEPVGRVWSRTAPAIQAALLVGGSALVWLATRDLGGPNPHGPPLAFVSYTGLLAGIVLAYPLEARWVDFDPRSSTRVRKLLRGAVTAGLVLGTLAGLDVLFAQLADDASLPGVVLRYLRYAGAGAIGILGAPLLFVRLGLAETLASAGRSAARP